MTADKTLTRSLDADAKNTAFAKSSARLLLVDDEPKNLRLLEAILTPHGYKLATATSGEECLRSVAELPPDLILLDIMMPGMDGYEVTARLRADETTRLIPIVVVSALSDVEDRIRGIQQGCDDFITKPFNKFEIQAKIQTTLRLSYYRRQLDEREKFEALVSRVSEGIVVATPDWTISRMNAAAAQYLNGTGIGDNLLDRIFVQYTVSVSKQDLRENSTSRKSLFLARTDENPSKSLYLHSWLDALQTVEGTTSSIVLTMRDMTKEQLKQREKDNFLNSVSDKLRIPLAEVSRGLENLKDGSLGALTKDQAQTVDAIADETRSLGDLVGKLSRFAIVNSLSIINNKNVDLPKDTIQVDTYLRELVDLAVKEAGHTNVEVRFGEQDKGAKVEISRVYFDMMIQHLVDNAIKFCEAKDVKLQLDVAQQDSQVSITLTDNGPGIAEDEAARIFEPFYQIERPSAPKGSGAGLGLALVKRLAEAYGGSIILESHPGSGSAFTILLPAG